LVIGCDHSKEASPPPTAMLNFLAIAGAAKSEPNPFHLLSGLKHLTIDLAIGRLTPSKQARGAMWP
jgi:hypothetical protein